jgi:hypothetical protein
MTPIVDTAMTTSTVNAFMITVVVEHSQELMIMMRSNFDVVEDRFVEVYIGDSVGGEAEADVAARHRNRSAACKRRGLVSRRVGYFEQPLGRVLCVGWYAVRELFIDQED